MNRTPRTTSATAGVAHTACATARSAYKMESMSLRHGQVRAAIEAILESRSFGPRALAISQVAWLTQVPHCPPERIARWHAYAAGLPADESCGDASAASSGLSMPDNATGLAAQCAELAIARPAQAGVTLARTAALLDLWPHSSRGERVQLRRLWYRGLCSCDAPTGSFVTSEELCEWQKRLPTIHDDDTPTAAALVCMLDRDDPERAHHVLAAQLGPHSDVGQLTAIFGGLANKLVLHRFDRHALLQNTLLGCTALGRIADRVPMGTALTLICQIAHRIWWCRHRAGLKPVDPGSQDRELSLAEAVCGADYTAAQRAARLLAPDRDAWWGTVFDLLDGFAADDGSVWCRALNTVVIALQRSGSHQIAPDDAAALGASLAAANWRQPTHLA